jgi:rhamnogalacturonan endolyase
MNRPFTALYVAAALFALVASPLHAQRVMERLGRGVAAVNQGDGKVFVTWRLFGNDPDGIAFNLYRKTGDAQPVKVNAEPITKATSYQDSGVDLTRDNEYFVRPVVNGNEGETSKPFLNKIAANSPARGYFEIPIKLPADTNAGEGSVGDLDGDGEYEIILKSWQLPTDTATSRITGNTIFQAYKTDGTLMWTISMGKNIREGEHDTQLMVYDLDGDGLAEVALKTGDGTVDGTGKVIGDPNADWIDRRQGSPTLGKQTTGPEYFTIFNGKTGAAMATTEYIPTREPTNGWGGIGGNEGNDNTGNRVNRFLACVAYLDGKLPSVIMCRGYYGRTVLAAWDWRDGKLTSRWVFDSSKHPNGGNPYVTASATVESAAPNKVIDNAGQWNGVQPNEYLLWDREGVTERGRVLSVDGNVLTVEEKLTPGANKGAHVYGYSGMGNHQVSVADVDDDGKDEIVYGAMVVDDDGKGLFTTGLRHGDSLHVGDLDPTRPGLEVWGPHENETERNGIYLQWTHGAALYDARTGKIIWGTAFGIDVGGAVSADVDPRYPGEEVWGMPGGLFSIKGEEISPQRPPGGGNSSFVIWWDGDPMREVLGGTGGAGRGGRGPATAPGAVAAAGGRRGARGPATTTAPARGGRGGGGGFGGIGVSKWDWQNSTSQVIFAALGVAGGRPIVQGDILGDWREELVLRTTDNTALRIYTSTIPTDMRLYTLMHDPQYREAIAWQNVAYNQPPHPSFFLGHDMKAPPKPNITFPPAR